MEKDNFSAEQEIDNQPSESVEYPEFDPDKAKELRETEATELAIGERKMKFLNNIDALIASGDLPNQLQDREAELWTIGIQVVPQDELKNEHHGHAASHMFGYGNLSNRPHHEIVLPDDILEYSFNEHMVNHELAHSLEGRSEDGLESGLGRLFEGQDNYLGMCLDEGMTEYMTELVSGQKNIYEKDKKADAVPGYPNYYKFIKFLSSAGKTEVDMKYFVDAYCLSGEEGDEAIAALRDKLAEAFPTENGTNPLDNLAAHNKDQIEYWIAAYTQNIN